MARAPRTGILLAFILVLFCAGAYSTYRALQPLVSNFLRVAKVTKTALPAPAKLEVHPAPTEPQASVGRPLSEALATLNYATDLASFKDFDAALQARLLQEDFAALETYGAALVSSKARFPGGKWKLHRFGETLAKCPTGEDSPDTAWQDHLNRLNKWTLAFPHSKTAPGICCMAWTKFAWKARGSGFADTVEPKGWELFNDRLKMGRTFLEPVSPGDRSPLWYSAMQVVALGQSWDRDVYDRLYDQAVASEPRYQSFYLRKAYYLMPRWHGSEGESEAFAAKAADKLGGEAGDQVFALVHMDLSNFQGIPEWRKKNPGVWPRMKRGLMAMGKEFGASLVLDNQCLRAAGYSADISFAKEHALAIHDHIDMDTWHSKNAYADFRDWALCQGKYAPKR
jgi:hypothetical protein